MRAVSFTLLILALLLSRVAIAQRAEVTVSRAARAASARSERAAARTAEAMRRRIDFIDGNTLREMSARFAGPHMVGETIMSSSDEQTTYLMVHRNASSKPEVHARWDDLVFVRSGIGAIETGDSLVGSTYRAPGERVSGTITKSLQTIVHPGDIVRIPAGVPHAFLVSGTAPLEYLVIKQRRQQLPIRWYGAK